jgi:alkanesulfonate monooxygenase SsuD/methylene tetrahydromethanopterin reductase-like flavin-dependent oxidoreductase (luciferase family)
VEFQRDVKVFVARSFVVAKTQDEFVEVIEGYICKALSFVAARGERVGRGPGCEGGGEAGGAGKEGAVVAQVLAVFFGELADCAALIGTSGELEVLWCNGGSWWWGCGYCCRTG